MVGTPIDVIPYIRVVQLVLIGYNGYTKGSRIENDKIVREDKSKSNDLSHRNVETVKCIKMLFACVDIFCSD